MSDDRVVDRPTRGPARSRRAYLIALTHPAFRIGFLDACAGKPFDADLSLERLRAETPANAKQRWRLFAPDDRRYPIALEQYRYEEGRIVVHEYGLTCGSWKNPDRLPPQLRRYIDQRLRMAEGSTA